MIETLIHIQRETHDEEKETTKRGESHLDVAAI